TAASIAALNTAMSAAEGFTIVETAAAANESFLIRPTFTAAANIGVEVNNVLDIALAAPVVSGELTNASGAAVNSGTGAISLPVANDAATLPLTEAGTPPRALTLTYAPPGFTVTDSTGVVVGNLAYVPATEFGGKTFDSTTDPFLLGYGDISFTISGQPVNGDAFIIGNNRTPFDDNRNGLLMAKLQTEKTLENSSTDFQAGYGIIVSDVGTKTHSAEIDLLAQQTLSEQAQADRDSFSGVNLDEEAVDLLKFQQAYQASARVISIADEMFQTLLGAVG
ncbi:MAG: flagellar basal body rod C-terminal domain-containing protein, partial [Gammaproteobacteria bacterium]|nr:flagellar basal body rod C-terminal domain-containing protein [Gammaproteobacteria bacterium]